MIDLRKSIENHKPSDAKEREDCRKFIDLLNAGGRCFYRDHFVPGHVTGSALLISRDKSHVLMNHHKSLNKWLCFGGHADGHEQALEVAMRECMEESGIENISPWPDTIVDIDVHLIPENAKKAEPAHYHYDARYIFFCNDNEDFALSDESSDLRWCDYNTAMDLVSDTTMRRLLTKWKDRLCR